MQSFFGSIFLYQDDVIEEKGKTMLKEDSTSITLKQDIALFFFLLILFCFLL